MLKEFQCPVDISEKIKGSWKIIPKRWVVERQTIRVVNSLF